VKEINTSKVIKIRSLNINLDLLCKDLDMKLGGIVEDYKVLLFSKFQKKKMSCESYELLKIICQI
jgi:hypothetical protein